jgi:hypothetical protein
MASFTVTGTLQGYSAPPTLQYRDDVPLVTTWDTADFTGPYSFTNGNKTATYGSSGSRSGVRATTPILAGQKVYFEVATSGFVSGSGFSVGVCQKSWPLGQTGDGAGGSTAVGDFCVHWDGVIDLGGVWINNPHQGTAPLDGIPNAWLTLPAGSTVTASTFSFPHTNIPNTGPHTISVRDANATTVTTTSNSFNVT